jgi:hypothetical protein
MSDLSPLCAQLRTLLVGLHHRSRASFRRLPCLSLRSGLNAQRQQQTGFHDLVGRAENERDRIRERIREVNSDRAAHGMFNGGRRTFGFDIDGIGKDRRLVPNAREQAALARGQALRAKRKTYRDIAEAWASEFGMPKIDAKSIQRMLERAAKSKKITRTPRAK